MIFIPRKGENIRKRKDGRWEARYIKEYDLTGKAKYQSVYGNTYATVKEQLKQVKDTKDLISYKNNINSSVEQIFIKWLKDEKIRVKQSTYAKYYDIVHKHIIPKLGQMKVKKLNIDILNGFVSEKYNNGRLDGKGGLSEKTVSDIVTILKQGLKGHCNFDLNEISKPKVPKNNVTVLPKENTDKLINYMGLGVTPLKIGILLALYTGIRLGELCALKWEDIDLSSGVIKINKTMQRIKNTDKNATTKTKIIIDTPKSDTSIREIPIQQILIDILSKYKQANHIKANAYILTGKVNKYVEPRLYQYKYKHFLEIMGIDDTKYHSLRHTFATNANENGFDTKSLSEILGHSNVQFTLEKYVHPNIIQKRSQMEKLDFPL